MYLSAYGESTTEKVIEKSRFITYASHVEGEEQAKDFLECVRSAHPLATHVCYGYIADSTGNLQRFSDDGEPQGTAGMPILNVIKARKLFQTSVAVVRYFGGIKLGAGGLTRAYASSAAEGLDAAEIREYDDCIQLNLTVEYPEVDALIRFLQHENVQESRTFGENAKFSVSVRKCNCVDFCNRLKDYLKGKVSVQETGENIFPFSVNSL